MSDRSSLIPDRSVAALMPSAGSGARFGDSTNKLFAKIDGTAMWEHSARQLRSNPSIGRIIMPIAASDRDAFRSDYYDVIKELQIELVRGGSERSDSVSAGLAAVDDDDEVRWIAVHDGARPLVRHEDIESVIRAAAMTDAAILVTPIAGTVRRQCLQRTETVDRRHLFVALTPQVFSVGLLKQAYKSHNGRPATDDAELVERIGHPVELVVGASDNLKITYPQDLLVAEAILKSRSSSLSKQSPN